MPRSILAKMPKKTTQTKKTTPAVMYFHHAGLTNTGLLRSQNEDAYKLPVNIDPETLAQKGHFYVLADGLGGHEKGEIASAVSVDIAHTEYYAATASPNGDNPQQVIIETMAHAIEQANVKVMEATEGGGTTIVAAVLYKDLLVAMNVGDSRAYLLRDDELQLISRDHSLVSRLRELGKITAEEALNHPRQNVLYQALGQGDDLEIHVFTDRLKLGDTVVLCSDGLWGPVGNPTIKEVVSSAASLPAAVEQLVDLANASGGPDNITVIIVRVSDQAPPPEQYMLTESACHPPCNDEPIIRRKPDTLPEGKFYRDKSLVV